MAVIKNTGESRRERTPLPWDEKCVALEDAIRRLPIAPVQDPQAMAYSDLIPEIARDLMVMSPIGPPAGYERKPADQTVGHNVTPRKEPLQLSVGREES